MRFAPGRWSSLTLPLLCVAMFACSDAAGGAVGPDLEANSTTKPTGNANSTPAALVGASLWVDPASNARKQADAWRATRPADAAMLDKIAARPSAVWLGDWMGTEPYSQVAALTSRITAAGAVPVFVVYNIPLRDCGQYSAGGASSPAAYERWVAEVARAIGSTKAVVILEPDAIGLIDCLTAAEAETRLRLISGAVRTLKASGSVSVYVDAGNAGWHPPVKMAPRLRGAGIEHADGFALNVSNFFSNAESNRMGTELSALLGGKHFVVDTSRNGLGASTPYEWCNPSGMALGTAPTTNTGHPLVDAYLWVKAPGESDGECNGGPSAGRFWSEYALGLAKRSAL